MKLIRCDKCGCVRQPDATRRVTITLCEGPSDGHGLIHWQELDVYKTTVADLCGNCWKDFVQKSNAYFKQEQ